VSKTVCDRLRAHLLSQGIAGIPDRNTAVFDVLQEHAIVQVTPDGKAIWRATVESDSGWTRTLTFLRLAPSVIWDSGERPAPFAGTVRIECMTVSENDDADPAQPVVADSVPPATDLKHTRANATEPIENLIALLDKGPSSSMSGPTDGPASIPHEATSPRESHAAFSAAAALGVLPPAQNDLAGTRLLEWLRESIRMRHLIINDANALVHTVDGTAFLVSPAVFKRYAEEHRAREGSTLGCELTQKLFERLQFHKRQRNGQNIWTCEVVGPRRRRLLHGYLLADPGKLFDQVPPDNPVLRLPRKEPLSPGIAE
jgi:hypothetical protein